MKPDVKRPLNTHQRFILGGDNLILNTIKSQALITYFYICQSNHNNDYVQIFNITLKDM